MSRRGPRARREGAILATLRRTADVVVAPARRLRTWERDPARGRVVRSVVRRPLRVALAAGLVVVVAGAIHLERFPQASPSGDVAADTTVVADEVGPRVGADLAAYVLGRHELLDAYDADEAVRAVVSFAGSVTLDALPVPSGVEVEAVQLVVPAQEREPRQLDLGAVADPDEVIDRFLAVEREELAVEIEELASTLEGDLGDPAFEADLERRLEELEDARDVLADDRELVYAAIVVAPAGQLRALREDERIRAVDPAGPADRTRGARFHGILPSDDQRATTGRSL